ncbi:endoplasmic reticulum aminopeptidase 1-like [Acanthaster planci]|uniref:Endoplasmic reticulum aminopeptidase 1-like n=1 Tax=Acanthaster planci TaxID=133434 RepID=A0A8B7XUR3_ACAPL|nr:endoplasmic reticulum aminopeptidase 1-like [Acanthaster planci]
MASGANYSPLREEPYEDSVDRLDFAPLNQDDEPNPDTGNPRIQAVGWRGFRGGRGCSKVSAVVLVGMVIVAILLIAVIASLARPRCVPPPTEPTSPPTAASSPAAVTTSPNAVTTSSPPVAAPTATNGEPFPWNDIRLPKSVKPIHYDLTLTTHLNNQTGFKAAGKVRIDFQAIAATDQIIMHCKNMTVTKPTQVTSIGDGKACGVTKMLFYETNEQLYLGLDKELTSGSNYTVTLQFSYELSDTLDGYYLSSYKENNVERYIASTQFEPTAARRAFPCFDEPALKATFSMKMLRAERLISLFNTALVRTTSLSNGMEKDEFNTTVPMSTYLVAFVVCDYVKISNTTTTGTDIAVYTSRGKIDQAHLALDVLQKTIPFYETFFDIAYPLSKQDMIAIPDFSAGAMENWGLITYRESSILYQEGVTSSSRKQWIVETVTHELAHQWFGNLVTMEWWNDLWLNEGFATYVQYIGTNHYQPDWHMMDQFTVLTVQAALEADSQGNSHPISVPVGDPSEINAIFDSISYDKGSSIIRMLNDSLPDQVFVKGLRSYLTKFKFSNAKTKDLWDAVSEAYTTSDLNIADMMDTWTLQMGYPVVTLSRKGTKVTATQKHFLHSPKAKPSKEFVSPFNYTWTIPLTYITSNDVFKTKSVTMDRNEAEVPFDLGGNVLWFKANSNQSGFYRVNYDSGNWHALINQLKGNHAQLSVADRANLIDDAFSLAWAGQLKETTALELSKYLFKETEYSPLYAALNNLNKMGKVLRNTEGYDAFVEYVLSLLTPQLERFGRNGWHTEEPHLQGFLKSVVIYDAAALGHPETVQNATKLFREWRDNDSEVPANLRSAVYCAGVKYGSRDDWEFCWNKYQATSVASEERVLLAALGCTYDPHLINRYLHWSMNEDKIKSQDTGTVISSIAGHSAGAYPALSFVIENWDTIIERFEGSPFEISYIIHAVTSSVSRKLEYEEASKFFLDHLDSNSGKRAVQQAMENMQANVDWLSAHRVEVTEWFKANTRPASAGNTR